MRMTKLQKKWLRVAAIGVLLTGCGKPDDAESAARSREANVPDGPMALGFWPAEPRPFALEKAKAIASGVLPADADKARVVQLPKVEVAKLPCVVELTFYQNKLLTVYVGFLTRDANEIRRVRESLTSRYGVPLPGNPAKPDFQQWLIKKPLPFTVVSDSAPGQLSYVSCWDAGPLFQAALPTITEKQAEDARRVKELAKLLD